MNDHEIAKKLRDCLVALTDGKVTERRKQVDNLKGYLIHSAYLQHLNKSSAKGSNIGERGTISITWTKVFNKIKDYIEQECSKFKEREVNNENLSSIVRNNIAKDKRSCSDLFRCFVKALKLNKQYELANLVVLHILAVLDEPFTQASLGVDYSNIFLKFVLYDTFMSLNIPAKTLEDAIRFYQKFVKSPPSNWNRSLTTEILLHLVTIRLNIGSWDGLKMLDFFIHIFDAVMSEKASRHHENLLQCLLLVCQNLKSDYPLRLCDVGEHVILPIMQLWKTRPSEKTQDLMLEFIRFQLALHHPKGAQKEEDGAQAFDWKIWKNHLINMYKLIMTELAILCERNKYPSGKELTLKPALISVAVEVYAQVFTEPIGVLDITQASTSFDVSVPSKKRKIDVSFRTLIENLSSSKIIPWLQVISAFLTKYSSIISVPEAVDLLDTLIDVHMSCNNIETKNWLLHCCQCFVQAFGSQDALKKDEASFQWQRVWELAVKSVALMHQCQEAGHGLLAILLSYKLVIPKTEFYNLYTPGSSNRVTKASLKTLAVFLENFSSSSVLQISTYGSSSISSDNFQNQVLEWLFSRKNDDNSPFQVVSDDTDLSTYEMFARVAALLCLQNNDCRIKIDILYHFTEPFPWITEMEDELVFITFGAPLTQIKSKETKSYPPSSIISQPVWEKILKFLIDATGSIFEEQICNMQFSTTSSFIRHSCLLFEMLQRFYFEGIIKKEELVSNIFMAYLKRSLLAIMEMFHKNESNSEHLMLLKDFMQHIILVINQNSEIFGLDFFEPFMSQIIKCIPEEMIMYLLNFSLNISENATSVINQNAGQDDMSDDEFAQPTKNVCSAGKEEGSDFDSNIEGESFCLMSTKNLPENFRLQMQCLEVTGQFLHLLVNESCINNVNGFPTDVLKKLVFSLPGADKRFKKASDVHLVLQLIKCILLTKNLDDEVIGKVLNSFRLLLNQLSQMQDVCQAILKLFPFLFSHIYHRSSIVSINLAKNKSRMLHLISVLCNKELEEKGSSLTSYHIVENLLKVTQLEPSSSWNLENRASSSSKSSERPDLIIDSLIKFMNSSFTSVRVFVAQRINEVISADVSDKMFQEIYSKTFELLIAAERGDDLSKKDEFSSRVNTLLHYLMRVILEFPCLEIESVFMMFKCIKLKLADEKLILKVLEQVAVSLGYENVRDFIEPHLYYLYQRWFDAKYKLDEFPFMILGVNSFDNFIEKFSKNLVPVLFYIGDMPSISAISEKLNISIQDALYVCLPSIQSLILSDLSLNRNSKNASTCHQLLTSNIPHEVCKKSIIEKLDQLVVCLLSLLKEDGTDHTSLCQVFNKCSMNAEEFMKTMSYIMSEADYNGSFTGFLSQRADCVQSIFLSLDIMLHKALRSHESRRILCMYQCFLFLLLPGLKSDLNCSIFAIHEVIYSMINFLTDKRYLKEYVKRDDACIEYCCNIIFCLCKETIEDFKETIGEFLPFIVSNLTPFASKSVSGKKVLALLKFLLVDCESHLVQYIPYLDPFPDEEFFASLILQLKNVKYKYGRLTLEQEIQFFLKSCKLMGRATKNGLDHLCYQLNSQKEDFHKLLIVLKEKSVFTEDVKNSILHDLVCQLASFCSPDNDFEIQKAAGNCLGVIGPVSFSSVVLQPSPHATVEKGHEKLTPLQKSFVAILKILIENIFHKSIQIKKAASGVLKEVLSTKVGYLFFKEYGKHFKNSNIIKYAYPFFACQNPKQLLQTCKYELNIEILEMSIWVPDKNEHSEWIKHLVCTLLECGLSRNNFYECLVPLCREEANFCEKFIPYLIHMIFLTKNPEVQKFLSGGISLFFCKFSQWMEKSSNYKESCFISTPVVDFPKASVQTMLSVLHYIWLHPNLEEKNSRNVLKDLWLDINYLDVAQAAQYCSAYFTAILYTELWCDMEREKSRNSISSNNSDSESLNSSPLSFIGSQDQEKASLVYDILLDSYSCIGDSDAISGCDLITADSQAILKHSYLIEKKWDGLLKLNDLQNSKLETLQALQLTGLNQTLLGYSQSLLQNKNSLPSQDILEYQCQAAWRMSQWDLLVAESSSHGFQEYFYKSQQSYYSENKPMFHNYLDFARKTQFEKLSNTSLESVRNILPVLSNVQLIRILEDFSNNHLNIESLKKLLNDWDLGDQVPYDDFEFVEPVSWLKCILLKHQVDLNVNKHIIIPELKKLLGKHCVKARDELYLEVASNAVHTLRKLPCMEKIDELQWQMEEAKILWTKKEYSIASKILKSTLHFIEMYAKENTDFLVTYGQALTLRGKWLAETCNENSSVIMRDYLEKAVAVLESSECSEDQRKSMAIWDAYLAVARYADAQHQIIINYKKSTAYQAKLDLMESSKQEIKKLKTKASTDDERKTLIILSKQLQIDQEEIKSIDQDQKQFLNKAISSYLKCLKGTDAHDLWIFRLISLWFQNLADEETNNIIQNGVKELQSYKFLPLMYQLAARMGTQASGVFTNTLVNLIMQIAIDHPHHALPVILALSNADKDPVDGVKDSSQSSSSQQSDVSSVKDRMLAAKKIASYLGKSKIGSFVKSYTDLCDAYISLAYYPVNKKTKQGTIPSDQPLLKFRHLQNIPIITEEVKIDRTCEYKNLIGIHSFNPEFRMCGGLTLPKVIKCLGTDGIEREQLVKGRDDLRQDAVMQQVFYLVNHLLETETETKRRRLHIRTYKVVPVSRRSGVLQWCEGTQVISEYLVDKDHGAHNRYYPMASLLECRKKMQAIASVSLLKKKREIFDSICASYPPVFRYFFLEHFSEPSAWFERRLCYTKSVAASSIVGYILGLGDRHFSNILIDKNTAEVVHIDFGIAFEKGRVLATPETVPFRLTRDIVDGMGISAVEGTFKRCSEKTLEVLRKSQDVLLTILDVLLHDPLYEWTVPQSKSKSQSSKVEVQEVNKLAERALMRLQQKLQGLEEGVAMSIEGQVNLLIQQARDPNNLCRLYAGWQPYL